MIQYSKGPDLFGVQRTLGYYSSVKSPNSIAASSAFEPMNPSALRSIRPVLGSGFIAGALLGAYLSVSTRRLRGAYVAAIARSAFIEGCGTRLVGGYVMSSTPGRMRELVY